jgi:hypothetical protein
MQLLSPFDRRRPRTSAGVRIAVGIWLLIGAVSEFHATRPRLLAAR